MAACLLGALAASADAGKLPFKWARRVPKGCEATSVFYSSSHRAGARPCCASAIGMCPGGTACPPSGVCAGGASCVAIPPLALTNVVLMISDDQGECHYGSAGECRSVQTGTPVRAPSTPNLDLLSGYGTIFPVAHNTAPWCFPSLTSILTGRYQKSMERQRRPATAFGTIATSLRSLDNNPFLPDDPYNQGNKVGGYCTGTRCDGKDLRSHLLTAPGGPAAPESLRHALCGHDTQRSTGPDNLRYLLTREGSVGRCTLLSAPACSSDAQCPGGRVCLGGHCMANAEPACSNNAACPAGAVCFGGRCRVGPSCTDDADCTALFPGNSSACVEKTTRWCRNDPSVRCTTRSDCPPCPDGGACRRLCEPRRVKFYFSPVGGAKAAELSDLFLDPDEPGLHNASLGSTELVNDMSNLSGPYGAKMRRVNCCVDDWWSEPASIGTICAGGCPADLTCNQ